MRCPFCGNEETQVKDSRTYDDGQAIRRRRCCPNCDSRFSTLETVIQKEIIVIKKDGTKIAFEKDKLLHSIKAAVNKRIASEEVEAMANDIIRRIEMSGNTEIKSAKIGEMVLDKLERTDKVAFIRFASVYMNFENPDDFDKFIKKLTG